MPESYLWCFFVAVKCYIVARQYSNAVIPNAAQRSRGILFLKEILKISYALRMQENITNNDHSYHLKFNL